MGSDLTREDRAYLDQALDLGGRGWGRVHPNPMVGCLLVRDGEVVGEGWHEEYGGPHAEVNALSRAGERARGATAYVSLEPCNHHGKTPPCTEALERAGVARVVYGAPDPGPESGGGGQSLRRSGMEVVGPAFSPEEARRANPAFFFHHEHRGTYVALKLAQTLDGRIAAGPGRRTAITGAEALREAHRLRSGFDGILVGSGTVLVDDPSLTVREGAPCRKPPARVVLDTEARTPPRARMFREAPEVPLVIFTAEDASKLAMEKLEDAGARVHPVPRGPGGLGLEEVLGICWETGIRSLLCEGGGTLASSLLEGAVPRRLYLFLAPFVLGEGAVPAFPGMDRAGLWEPWAPALPPRLLGRDVLLTYDRTD